MTRHKVGYQEYPYPEFMTRELVSQEIRRRCARAHGYDRADRSGRSTGVRSTETEYVRTETTAPMRLTIDRAIGVDGAREYEVRRTEYGGRTEGYGVASCHDDLSLIIKYYVNIRGLL